VLPPGYTAAGRVAPYGKPPNEAAQVKSPLRGPLIVSSRCSCGSSRVDFRYYLQNAVNDHNPSNIVDCHCPSCRRFHATAFVRYIKVPENDASVTGDSIVRFRDTCMEVGDVLRTYCRRCSTKLLTIVVNRRDDDNTVLINMGPIDDKTIPEDVAKQWETITPIQWRMNMQVSWLDAVVPDNTRHNQQPPRPVTVSGGCTCGAYQYEFELQNNFELQHCYCSLCRQLSGGAFMTWVPIQSTSQHFQWLLEGTVTKPDSNKVRARSEGEAPLVRYTDIGQRHVCNKCGGVLSIWYDFDAQSSDGATTIWLSAGSFDSIRLPFNIEPYLERVVHICCNYKPAWYTIPEDGVQRLGEAS